MSCTELCRIMSFGSSSRTMDAKFCLSCQIFLLTESEKCACCGSAIERWVKKTEEDSFKSYPSIKNKVRINKKRSDPKLERYETGTNTEFVSKL